MASCHYATNGMRAETATKFRNFLAAHRVQPPFRLNLNQEMTKWPGNSSRTGVHVNTTILTELRNLDSLESSLDKKVFDDVLKLFWGIGEKFSPDGLNQLVILLAFWLRCRVHYFTIFDCDLFPSISQYFLHDKTVVLYHNTF